MPFFDAVTSSGIDMEEGLINEAKDLINLVGPYVNDQEALKLICLLQIMTPPKTWTDKVN